MGWDSSRPVPWRRLIKEYAIYAAIMAVILLLFFRDRGVLALLIGIVAAGPLYLLMGAVLAKFGYQRKTLAELRTPRATTNAGTAGAGAGAGPRPRPAPTRRTSTGPSQRKRRR